jgi:hypothetical protein
MNEFFEKRMLIETKKEITIELENEITAALKKVFKKHKNEFRYIVDFEYGIWVTDGGIE